MWCSIWIGFMITSMTSLVDNRYAKYLYKHVKYPSGRNGLQVVVSYFTWNAYFLLITLMLAVFFLLYNEVGSLHFLQKIVNNIAYIIVSLSCVNFYMSWVLIKILLKAVYEDGALDDYDNLK